MGGWNRPRGPCRASTVKEPPARPDPVWRTVLAASSSVAGSTSSRNGRPCGRQATKRRAAPDLHQAAGELPAPVQRRGRIAGEGTHQKHGGPPDRTFGV